MYDQLWVNHGDYVVFQFTLFYSYVMLSLFSFKPLLYFFDFKPNKRLSI